MIICEWWYDIYGRRGYVARVYESEGIYGYEYEYDHEYECEYEYEYEQLEYSCLQYMGSYRGEA